VLASGICDALNENWVDDSVTIEHDKRTVNRRFGLQYCMTSSELRRLFGVLDRHSPVATVTEVIPNPFVTIPDDECDVIESCVGDRLDDILKQWSVCHGNHRLWPPIR
jgi:hypothetical protein